MEPNQISGLRKEKAGHGWRLVKGVDVKCTSREESSLECHLAVIKLAL